MYCKYCFTPECPLRRFPKLVPHSLACVWRGPGVNLNYCLFLRSAAKPVPMKIGMPQTQHTRPSDTSPGKGQDTLQRSRS